MNTGTPSLFSKTGAPIEGEGRAGGMSDPECREYSMGHAGSLSRKRSRPEEKQMDGAGMGSGRTHLTIPSHPDIRFSLGTMRPAVSGSTHGDAIPDLPDTIGFNDSGSPDGNSGHQGIVSKLEKWEYIVAGFCYTVEYFSTVVRSRGACVNRSSGESRGIRSSVPSALSNSPIFFFCVL